MPLVVADSSSCPAELMCVVDGEVMTLAEIEARFMVPVVSWSWLARRHAVRSEYSRRRRNRGKRR